MGWMVPPTTCQLGRHFPLRDCSVFFPTTPPFPYVSRLSLPSPISAIPLYVFLHSLSQSPSLSLL